MKKCFSLLLICVLIACAVPAWAASADSWTCPYCGSAASGNFCSNCGAKREEAVPQDGGLCSLTLYVDFEENMVFSTYDVKMFLDDDLIAVLNHGKDYHGTVETAPGKHVLKFTKDGDSSVNGTWSFTLTRDGVLSVEIHAKRDQVKLTGASLEQAPAAPAFSGSYTVSEDEDDRMIAEAEYPVQYINGSIEVDLSVSFEKNAYFSTYDVQLYCDGVLVATLPHGENFNGTLGVSSGVHVLTFQKDGDASIRGISQFSAEEDTSFSCNIEAKYNKVKVSGETVGSVGAALSRENYIAACVTVAYEDVERRPENFKGLKICVTGKVIQVVEGWFDTVTLRVRDENGSVWSVTYTRPDGEPRVLEDDQITVYGECRGVKTYRTITGSSTTLPAVKAKYVVIR